MRRLHPDPAPLDEADLDLACAPDDPAGRLLRVNFIASIDGAVTLDGRSGGLGNPTDQAMMARLRMYADIVLVGAGTIRTEGYGPIELPPAAQRWRLHHGKPANPRLAIATRTGDLPERVRAADPVLLADPTTIHDLGAGQVLCEGGSHLFGTLAAAGLVDELFLTLSPLLAGPGAGRIIAGPPMPPQPMRLRHLLTDGELLYSRYTR